MRVTYTYRHSVTVTGRGVKECLANADRLERTMPDRQWTLELEYDGADWEEVPWNGEEDE